MTNFLEVECQNCKLRDFCPKVGSSPLNMKKCKIYGGYGRTPVDAGVLSEESLALMERNGPCLNIVDIPTENSFNGTHFELTKIFAPPILHEREKVGWPFSLMYPKSHT